MTAQVAPFGSWISPITAERIASGGVMLGGLGAWGSDIYWHEQRPAEGGRIVVVRRSADGTTTDLVPEGFNARTQVHEYGGGAWFVDNRTLFFSNWTDQRLYRIEEGASPVPITSEPPMPRGLRYADGVVTPDGRWIVCVRESHQEGREATNELVILSVDGSSEPRAIVSGKDFYSFPRLSPDGTKLAWTEWSHPNLPWDGTTLLVGDLSSDGLSSITRVAGGPDESIFQPEWGPDGELYYVSDRTGWWNIYRGLDGAERLPQSGGEPVCAMDAEFGEPQWVFGQSTYAFLDDGDIVCSCERKATDALGIIRRGSGAFEEFDLPYTWTSSIASTGERLLCVAATPTEAMAVVAVDPRSRTVEILKRSRDDDVDPEYISVPEPIEFESGPRTAHAFFYAPANVDYEGPSGSKPPLIVFSHGGPTGHVASSLTLAIQFWTSRGFAVVDVNYGGSTGYGRAYRRLLNGNWGVVDVEDCVNAARYLAGRGDVDPDRMAIRGGSAGGFTTLAALVFTDVFKAGANYFGVADFTPFVTDTHKFESRYLDTLVGPYPKRKDLYYERSPANFVDRISCPLITFQGLEDAIVPPSQSERIVEALRAKGLPFAYVTYEGEQHGFRKAENIKHSLSSELYFYGQVFGFTPADDVEPVEIENL